jgi:multiple sugar transport system permease protein
VRSFIVSFQRTDLIHPPMWVGMANFRLVLGDPLFWRAWGNTVRFTGLTLLFGYLWPAILAILINEIQHARRFFRLVFYLPVVIPPMVALSIWKWFYDPGPGLANSILRLVGLPPQAWLQSSHTALPALALQATWASAGGWLLLYLAALRQLPAYLYDAAEVDGANIWQRLVYITLPQLRGLMAVILLVQIVMSMQAFTTPFVMTDGGPAHATLTLALLLYRYAFTFENFGAASAVGLCMFLVLASTTIGYQWLLRRFDLL